MTWSKVKLQNISEKVCYDLFLPAKSDELQAWWVGVIVARYFNLCN